LRGSQTGKRYTARQENQDSHASSQHALRPQVLHCSSSAFGNHGFTVPCPLSQTD
jgi:hypothetical protein